MLHVRAVWSFTRHLYVRRWAVGIASLLVEVLCLFMRDLLGLLREREIRCSLFDELFAIRSLNDIMAGNRISGENPSISCSFCQSRAQMIQKWMTNSTKNLASLF